MNRSKRVVSLVITAMLLAIGLVLPFLTAQLKSLGQAISPLHIPALIGGLTCGWGWGAALGFILPLLRSAIFGRPLLFPDAFCMTFELCAYGLATGALYPALRKKMSGHMPAMIVSMLVAMVAGRVLGGVVKAVVLGLQGGSFTMGMFVSMYFVNTLPGIVLHLILVPVVTLALERAKLSPLA